MNSKCRTCLNYSTKTFPLTKKVPGCVPEITYAEILKDYAQFEYNEAYEPHLSQHLCFLCCTQLKSTHIFIQQAKQCNVNLINDIINQLCLKEQAIDLPQCQDEATISIEIEHPISYAGLKNQKIRNRIAKADDGMQVDNVVANRSFIAEPAVLTTEHIIEYDSEDNLDTNTKSLIAEPILIADEIIEYDSEVSEEEDTNGENFSTATSEDSLSKQKKKSLHKQKPLFKGERFKCEKCSCDYKHKTDLKKHIKRKHTNIQREEKKSVKCQLCDYVARCTASMSYHKRVKHGTKDDKLKCKFCSYSTRLNKSCLLRHIKSEHSELIKNLKAKALGNRDERQK